MTAQITPQGRATIINLLLSAGFLVVLLLAPIQRELTIYGLLLFASAAALNFTLTDTSAMRRVGTWVLGLIVADLALYSSVELLPYLDTSLLLLLVLAGFLALCAAKNSAGKFSLKQLPFLTPMVIFLLSVALSALGAAHVKDVMYFFGLNLIGYFIFSCLVISYRGRELPKNLMIFVFTTGVASALLAIWQLYSPGFKQIVFPFLAERDRSILLLWQEVSRVVGTWQHPSYLGLFLAVASICGVYLLFWAELSAIKRACVAFGLIITSAALLLTNTRSSVIGAWLGILLLYVLVLVRRYEFVKRLPRSLSLVTLGVIAACAMLLYQFVFVSEIYRKPQAWRVDASATIWGRFLRSDMMSTESLVQRSQLYQLAQEEFFAHPIVGIGAKNFSYAVTARFTVPGTDAHNLILQTAAECGIVGLAALIFLFSSIVVRVRKTIWGDLDLTSRRLVATSSAVLVLFLFDSFFNNPLYSLRLTVLFWVFLSCVIILQQNNRAQA
ncbi:MAG: hypothetical protein A2722_01240 [Candidatus Doudnabacteria bacterium RIFCSPHIGHO2_01_FULL_50_11]|uniref:O-antigen ligase-related domain-containing protein n=1 Tax=Candidatus Doudnabacteria bacterium RIFCSPHIGHO2_01_FULL_50_11 TaxID=1817828 RepID=A0A1F5PEV6_9BACT|nr:MAG: hypothetical protein A2722_01240 [Candidatus Doudnabacteria bacterium RIFCSPHIGHO2_01_FULL_50_11]HLC45193.1 O-antigen ligase family protein [Patescibacteria group bacterium]